ncbi:MAG: TetR/AcrR family transcriptional regulator [Pseudomonadota bacterium]
MSAADTQVMEKVGHNGAAPRGAPEILQAAAHCFKENGFAATSIDDVARALGATKGMVYHHHRSKTDLFFAVYRRGMELNTAAISPYLGETNALTKLTRMGFAHAMVLMEEQPFQRVLAQGVAMHQTGSTTAAQRETLLELIEIRKGYERIFREAIEAVVIAEKLSVGSISLATKSFLAVLNSAVFWYSPQPDESGEEQRSIATDQLTYALRGLGLTVSAGNPIHKLIEQERTS